MENKSVNRRELTEEEINMIRREEYEWLIKDEDAEPVTGVEIARIREMMSYLDDEYFSKLEFYRKKGCICVNTPRDYWACLMGRLWVADLEKGTVVKHWCS